VSSRVALQWLTVCEWLVLLLTHILGDLRLDTIESFFESFLDDHTVQETWKENFVVLGRIGVVGTGSSRNQRVKFSKHKAEDQHNPLLPIRFDLHEHSVFVSSVWQVDKHDSA
jgi:hypothetical protein